MKYIAVAFLCLIFCLNLLFFSNDELLKRFTPAPEIIEICIPGDELPPSLKREEGLSVDIYRPGPGMPVRSKMLVIHGATEFGKNDPRLVRICLLLARVGFELFVPNVKELMEWEIGTSGVDDIIYIYERFLRQEKDLSKGMLSYSTGCTALFLAASREGIGSDIDYLVSFGGYFDAKNMLLYMTTGCYQEDGVWKKSPYDKEIDRIFLQKNLSLLKEQDREAVSRIIEEGPDEELMGGLSEGSRMLIELLYNEDRERFYQLYDKIDPAVKKRLEQASPRYVLDSIKADCYIAHSVPDYVIPHTESALLVENLKGRVKGYYTFRFFHHVERRFSISDIRDLLFVYIPDMVKFYIFMYKIMTL